jgi:hypothetical protein
MELQQVQFCSVTFVLAETILRELSAKVTHHPVARNLGDHARGSNTEANAITINDRCLRKWKGDYRQAIDQNMVGRFEELFDRQSHGAMACTQNVDSIDLDRIDNSDSPSDFRVANQFAVDFFARVGRELLGIVQATMTKFFWENHCRRHNWTSQGAATRLINPGNARDADGAELFLVTKSAAAVHPPKSLADLRE